MISKLLSRVKSHWSLGKTGGKQMIAHQNYIIAGDAFHASDQYQAKVHYPKERTLRRIRCLPYDSGNSRDSIRPYNQRRLA